MKSRLFSAVVAAIIGLYGGIVRADSIIYNSLDQSAGTSVTVPSGLLADSFTTFGTDLVLTDVQLYLSGQGTGTGSITIKLYSNFTGGNSPFNEKGTIGTLSDSSATLGNAVYDFHSFTKIALTSNTRYWIGLTSSNGSDIKWVTTSSIGGTGVAGEFHDVSNTITANASPSAGPFQMRLTTVPEPSSWILCGIAGLGALGFQIRNRRGAVRPV